MTLKTSSIVFGIILFSAVRAFGDLRRGPVLLFEDGVVVVQWESDREEGSTVTCRALGESSVGVRVSVERRLCIHRHRLTGLSPGTQYRYSLTSGESSAGPWGFRTPEKGKLRVVALGEPWGEWKVLISLAGRIREKKPHLLLFPCGLRALLADPSRTAPFFDALGPLLASIPLLAPPLTAKKARKAGLTILANAKGRRFRQVSVQGISFLLMPDMTPENRLPNLPKNVKPPLGFALALLPSALFSGGPGGSSFVARQALWHFFAAQRVRLVLSGGDRLFERTRPMRVGTENRTLVQIVTGGGGAPLHRLLRAYWTAEGGSYHHFLLIAARPDGVGVSAIDELGIVRDMVVFQPDGAVPGGGGPLAFIRVSLTPTQKETMKSLSRVLDALEGGLGRNESLGMLALAVELAELSKGVGPGIHGASFSNAARSLAMQTQELANTDFKNITDRLAAKFRAQAVRGNCRRCHGLHR